MGALLYVTIVEIPIGKALSLLALLHAMPFGKEIVQESEIVGKENVSPVRRFFGTLANIIWLPFGLVAAIGDILPELLCASLS